jgi:cellobiose phosphorylase
LSGSASWAYYTVTQYILGIQPDYYGLKIDPCIPSDWKELNITRRFRKKNFNIAIKNQGGVQKGVKRIIINGKEIEGNLISLDLIKENNEVLVVLGRDV